MIEVLKKMVEALEWCHGGEPIGTAEAIQAGNQAIAELESQEPFCYVYKENGEDFFAPKDGYYPADAKPLYTHPPQRTEPKVCCQQYDTCLEPCTPRGRHLAQLEQEYDNSAVHLAHCYQGEYSVCKYGDENCPAIPKVKAQQEQEPPDWFPAVENILKEYGLQAMDFVADFKEAMKDAEQSQRTWVGLTDEEFNELDKEDLSLRQFVQAIEAKLKEKNG